MKRQDAKGSGGAVGRLRLIVWLKALAPWYFEEAAATRPIAARGTPDLTRRRMLRHGEQAVCVVADWRWFRIYFDPGEQDLRRKIG